MTVAKTAPAACLIGWPAAHSRSPVIHHHWLRKLGIEGGYSIEAVPPEEFAEFVLNLSHHGFVGANVTIPHKERALALSVPDERATAVGAANTLWYEGGELRSTNTDVEGFVDNLDAMAPGWDQAEEAVVLGAGGARFAWAPNLLLWAALVLGSVGGALVYHAINLAAIWFAATLALALSAMVAATTDR